MEIMVSNREFVTEKEPFTGTYKARLQKHTL